MILGIDTSYANGYPDWNLALDDAHVQFVIARVCYGANPADDDGTAFTSAHDAVKADGRPFGAFAFWLAGQDGKTQAQHFLTQANGRFGEISPVIDIEEGSGAEGWGDSVQSRIENVGAWLDTVQAECGQPMIYTNADTWSTYFGSTDAFLGHRLWIANYTGTPGQFEPIPGLPNVVLHQFSDGTGQSPIAGLSTPGNNVDRDALIAPNFAAIGRP